MVTDLKKHEITQVALGKAHVVALTNKGQVFTFGINNKGQCGRDFPSAASKEGQYCCHGYMYLFVWFLQFLDLGLFQWKFTGRSGLPIYGFFFFFFCGWKVSAMMMLIGFRILFLWWGSKDKWRSTSPRKSLQEQPLFCDYIFK